jgi:hypothetical protein
MMAAAAISTTTAITSRMTPAASLAATTTRSSRICDILNPMYTTRIYNKNVRSLSTTSNEEESKNNDKQYEYILTETRGNVGMITLHRPKALNALCDGLFADLIHAAKSYQNNDEIGCIVLTGSPKSFAAGADISEMKDRNFDYAYQKVRTYSVQCQSWRNRSALVAMFFLPIRSSRHPKNNSKIQLNLLEHVSRMGRYYVHFQTNHCRRQWILFGRRLRTCHDV